jgi:hypothetical protein
MKNTMYSGFAIREQNAFDCFSRFIESKGFSHENAVKVWNLYIKLKVMKIDMVNGTFHVRHGMFLDSDIITNAINNY